MVTLSEASSSNSSPKIRKAKGNDLNILTKEYESSSSEDEEEMEQKIRLELKNPMFPKIY